MNNAVNDQALTRLGAAEIRVAAILSRPKPIAIACIVSLAALGWGAIAVLPGDPAAGWAGAICRPARGGGSIVDAGVLFAMWAAMTLAMMIPTAGPMILTYAEIADTAARKSERVVSPIVLTAGYTVVWLGFAAAAASMQMMLASLAGTATVGAAFAGLFFLAAGIYQFSALKQACLAHCQRPFPFFFANWTARRRGVFALGLRQGIYCLGCCWALMLVMLTTGAMNVLWMAALGIVMTIEKMSATPKFSRVLGVAFIVTGAAMIALEFR